MKKILISLALILSAMNIMAVETLKVVPFTAEAGVTNDDYEYSFEITLDNEKADYYTGFQFNMTLPEGMGVKDGSAGFEFSPERFEGITKKGVFTPQHGVKVFALQKDGSYLVSVADEKLSKVKGTSGTILYVYYTTTADFQGGTISLKKQMFFPDGKTTINGEDSEATVATGVAVVGADADAAKASKYVKNGKIVIVKGEKEYNAAGAQVK